MKLSRITRGAFWTVPILILVSIGVSQNLAPKQSAEQILQNRAIWGKDFSILLSQVPSWHAVGEKEVEVLPNRVVGLKSYRIADSKAVMSQLTENLQVHQHQAVTAVDEWLNNPQAHSKSEISGMEKVMQRPSEEPDNGVRVEVSGNNRTPEFIKPGLTESDLSRELGAAENVSYVKPRASDTSKYNGRPEIIKVYSYAGGEVRFEVSNLSPYPPGKDGRLIQKAIIDTSYIESLLPPAAK